MKKIIHLSDIHVGYKDHAQRFRTLAENLVAQEGLKASDYVVVITGDLVDNANNPTSYDEAKTTLDFLKTNGFVHVLVVPGNHDYGSGKRGNKKFVNIFSHKFYGMEITFPKKDIIDDIAFLGLDSMAEELHFYDELFADGELGTKQLKRLEEMLSSQDVRMCRKRVIYMHHHPFKWRPLHQLKDSRRLKRVLNRAMAKGISIDALLFGHNHEGKLHHGKWGIPRCYDAGTATLKPRPKFVEWCPYFQVKSSSRVIDLDDNTLNSDYELDLL